VENLKRLLGKCKHKQDGNIRLDVAAKGWEAVA
jgi:hypothetical protein